MQPLLNGSIPSLQTAARNGASTHLPRVIVAGPTAVTYFNSHRKKIFLLLCAFIMGTWIGSSLPNYHQFGSQATCPTVEQPSATRVDSLLRDVVASRSNSTSPSNPTTIQQEWPTIDDSSSRRADDRPPAAPSTAAAAAQSGSTLTSTPDDDGSVHDHGLPTDPNYLVYTPYCRIPRFDPRDPSVLSTIKRLEPLHCAKSSPAFTFMEGNALRVDTTGLQRAGSWDEDGRNVSCCYSVLRRSDDGKTDDGYSISGNCTPIEENVTVTLTDEFVKVVCKSDGSVKDKDEKHEDFVYTVPLKPSVEERLSAQFYSRFGSSDRGEFVPASVLPFSVMLIGIDAVSRLNFERHLVRTRRFLLDEMHAIEMMGYNKVGENTFPNLAALLTGYTKAELLDSCWKDDRHHSLDNCSFAWSRFSELGFRTLYGEDSHGLSTFNYLKQGFYRQPTDYYFRPFSVAAENAIGQGKVANTRLCLGSRPVHEASIGWARAFMHAMVRRQPYFGLLWSNSLTHDDANFVQRADPFLHDMLIDLNSKQRLNNTVLIFISDHGIRWGALRRTRIGGYEERLPALYIALPPRFHDEFPEAVENLRRNSHRLTSTFDLHKTLLALASLGSGSADQFFNASGMSLRNDPMVAARGVSLFEEVPWNRSCSHAGVTGHWCACEENVALDVRSSLALDLAERVVQYVNNATYAKRSVCALLELGEVSGFVRKSSVEMHEKVKHHSRYAITVTVAPSLAVFEATVLTDESQHEFRLEDEITRVNMYGDQSRCVDELSLKPFCFCNQTSTGSAISRRSNSIGNSETSNVVSTSGF